MTTTTDPAEYAEAELDTPFNAISVKQKKRPVDQRFPQCGRLCKPPLVQGGHVRNDKQMYDACAALPEVVVIGHADMGKAEQFVWRGTPAEFYETWMGD